MHIPPSHPSETMADSPLPRATAVESLRRRRDFLQVQGSRHRFSRPAFLLTMLALPELGTQAALGFTVTRKLGNAVTRNRCKRRLRAIAQELLATQALAGYAYVWIARSGLEAMDFDTLRGEMRWALRKLHAMLAADSAPGDGGGQWRGRGSKKHKPQKKPAAAAAAGSAASSTEGGGHAAL